MTSASASSTAWARPFAVAQNASASSAAAACVSAGRAGDPASCSDAPVKAHTWGKPERPLPPAEVIDPALDAAKDTTLFVSWVLPYANELPIVAAELSFDNATYDVGTAAVGGLNVSGLAPATQYGVRARSSNSLGWGDWSDLRFLSTKPVPPKTPAPLCDEERTARRFITQ